MQTVASVFQRCRLAAVACGLSNPILQRAAAVQPSNTLRLALPLVSKTARRGLATKGDIYGSKSRFCAVLGAQWGDEGKGKLVDILAKQYDIVARFNGGNNAGHTLVVDGKKHALHLLPCGILYPDKMNVIGNGVVVHFPTLVKELDKLDAAGINWKGRLKISDRAQVLFDFHPIIDAKQEESRGGQNIGTTKRGIGPAYANKITRNGVRVGDLVDFAAFSQKMTKLATAMQAQYGFTGYDPQEELGRFEHYRQKFLDCIIDSVYYLNSQMNAGKRVLAEGANAALLDVDFGTYPYVTSSSTAAGGISTGLGIAPSKLETTIGIVKAYTTRVGAGPFPTELNDATGELIRKTGAEFGTTTGRPRRCGWLDLPVLHYSHMLNNYSSFNVTKLDVLSGLDTIRVGVSYQLDGKDLPKGMMPSRLEDLARVSVKYKDFRGWKQDISKVTSFSGLPDTAKAYLEFVEQQLDVPLSFIGVGPGRTEMIRK